MAGVISFVSSFLSSPFPIMSYLIFGFRDPVQECDFMCRLNSSSFTTMAEHFNQHTHTHQVKNEMKLYGTE